MVTAKRIKRILFTLVVFSFVTLLTMYVHTVYTLNINNNNSIRYKCATGAPWTTTTTTTTSTISTDTSKYDTNNKNPFHGDDEGHYFITKSKNLFYVSTLNLTKHRQTPFAHIHMQKLEKGSLPSPIQNIHWHWENISIKSKIKRYSLNTFLKISHKIKDEILYG